MRFTAETASEGVLERDFTVGGVPGVLFSPTAAPGRMPLVLMGHGGLQHKRAPGIVARARRLVTALGCGVVCVDLPGHGERPATAQDERYWAELQQARAAGESIGVGAVEYSIGLAERAVPEWRTALDALQELPEFGASGPVGYSGALLSTAIGVPLMAADARITAAVFRCFFSSGPLLQAAGRVTAPVQLLFQWDDEDITREDGMELFEAFASKEKTMHISAGTHHQLPAFEGEDTARFFARHFGAGAPSPA